ncbi:MAG: RNA polymerase sigma factor [Planctomycetota bacterium]|jgi:RNA polymerase sigma-70 factor (ECF subfamily)
MEPARAPPSFDPASDEALASRILGGETAAFDLLVGRWRDRIVDLAHLLTGDRDAAEDIGQEVFLRFYRRPGAYDPARPFAAWICTVARNLCHDRYRRETTRVRHQQRAVERRYGPRPAPAPPEAASAAEVEARLREAIVGLPPKFREAFVLCAVRGHSYDEAARICRCPVKTVSTRLARARKRLVTRMRGWL